MSPPRETDAQMQKRWRAENALSTLTEAERVRKDAGLMRDVKRLAAEKTAAMSAVTKSKPASTRRR